MPNSDKIRIIKEAEKNINGHRETNWRSIYVASALSFVVTTQFALYFSSLWPYLQIIDRSIPETFFGYIIAIYSVGQTISAPLFGYWSNKIKTVRVPYFVGLCMMFVGNALYMCLELNLPFERFYLLLLGRFVTGMGSGNLSLLRTYAATASTSKDRHRAIAFVTCGQALGMTSGPAFQLLFTALSYPGISLLGGIHLNLYTAPAWFACGMNAFGALALYFLFQEEYVGLLDGQRTKNGRKNKTASGFECGKKPTQNLPPYDLIAIFVCYVTRFTQMFINTNLETLGSPYSMMMFGWGEEKAVAFTSAAQGAIGCLTLAMCIAYISLNLEKFLNLRASCIIPLAGLIVFHLITYSWPFLPGHVPMFNSTKGQIGCDTDKFAWCEDLRPVNVVLYYATYIPVIEAIKWIAKLRQFERQFEWGFTQEEKRHYKRLGLAFSIQSIALNTLFSKIIGPRWQSTQQGIMQVAGSVARLIGPIMVTQLYTSFGPNMTWNMEILVIAITLISWLIFYRRMVPLKIIEDGYKNMSTISSEPSSENSSVHKTVL
ncbi:major facilitator superfamily domain-containing protein [Ditylenchus destructor]|uniref:Major facilitator superfamily domain-containing protein n=1 Tax=Ditylenchus destructor TaxID=166010 RepID=A0AAD4MR23_9BILA|nr:major facilitator superfamily domain-containing protein [Ditylenchus destructor]